MGIGGSIFLLAIGAILAWAVHAQIGFLDLRVVGYVLMVAGLLGLLLTLYYWNRRRQVRTPVPVERQLPEPRVGERRIVEDDLTPPEQEYGGEVTRRYYRDY
ncbi:MAG: hypothetical protein J2P15_22065 [Micromonosporaceae bacterium]|nr:hypothetical protein [Micromonosporaceae bacterium]